jgi:endonuclease/exonuclease/phosphatase family metal-dependent hydrolase
MRKNLKWLLLAPALISFATPLRAQTNPAAVSLPFTLSSQSSATLPSGVAIHRFSTVPATRTTSPASSDLATAGNSPTGFNGGWYYLGTDGIGLLNTTSIAAGAVVVAINTSGLNNINISWVCKTILNQASRDNSMALQYRIGTTGNFTDLGTASTYTSAGKVNGDVSPTYSETLPAAAENQPVVQLRWVYWESNSAGGARDKIALDDISISSAVSSCAVPAIAASGITDSTAAFTWNNVPSAIAYEYVLDTISSAPVSGTTTTDTSYAAAGLNAATTYYLHVRSNCGSGNLSAWTAKTITTTYTPPQDIPEFTVMTYNLLNYPSSTPATREPFYRTVVNAAQPDILVVQELSGSSGITSFLNNVLNFSGSSYSAGSFTDGPDTDNGIFYKHALFQFISNTPISTSLRYINQYKMREIASGDTIIIYSVHLKASNTSADETQRANEVANLRAVTDLLPAGQNFMVCGDFNIYRSGEAAYQGLTQNGSNPNGKFNDLLSMSGTWNNSLYAPYHTQSPRTTSFGGGATGGMDDRFDMFLFSDKIIQSGGYDIVSNSYKAFGNDGFHYNAAINTPPYATYDSVLCAALHGASDHLPVVVKLKHSSSTITMPLAVGTPPATPMISDWLTVYPNPAHDRFFLKINYNTTEPLHLCLYDLSGRKMKSVMLQQQAAGNIVPVDVSDLPGGIFYFRAPSMNGAYKVVKY